MTLLKFSFVPAIFLLTLFSCHSGPARHKQPKADTIQPPVLVADSIFPPAQLAAWRDEINDFYQRTLIRSGFNGGILVAKKGAIIFEKYHGFFNLHTKDSLTEHSAFHLASVSKTFTAMATLKLVQEGKLSLDDSLQKFFPGFPYPGVTVKLLLNHRSGLPNYLYFMEQNGWDRKKMCSNEDILDYLIKFHPPGTGRPNTHFSYCNTNYSLLALIIQKASGESYATYLKNTIFAPLGMNDTYVYDFKRDSATAMPSYDYRGRPEAITCLDMGVGDKNIYSTPRDMLKWDQALYTHKILDSTSLAEAYTPYSNEKKGVRNYGLGWRMNVYPNGRKLIYHNGWWHGNNTVFIRDIQDSVTIIVLGNKFNKNIYQAKKIIDFFNGGVSLQDESGPE